MRTQDEIVSMFEATKKQLDEIEEAPRTGDSQEVDVKFTIEHIVIRRMKNDTYKRLKRCNNCGSWTRTTLIIIFV